MGSENHQVRKDHDLREDPAKISHLTRREIQAPVAACLIRAFIEEVGCDRALEVASEAIRNDAAEAGKAVAAKYGGNTMAHLARAVREIWCENDALVLRVLEETDRAFHFDVTRCRYAEMYEKLRAADLGYCLSCNRDGTFAEGFNPRIKLTRTQTIMEGAPYCGFRFALDSP